MLLGALAVGGDGELSVQLASSNVTGNSLELVRGGGGCALGMGAGGAAWQCRGGRCGANDTPP